MPKSTTKNIVFICRDNIESLPPIINSIYILSSLGHKTSLITTSLSTELASFLHTKNVDLYRMGKISRGKNIFVSIKNNLRFRTFTQKIIQPLIRDTDVFWIAGASTGLSLYRSSILKHIKYIFSCLELYDYSPLFKNVSKFLMQHAYINVVPEINRALIYKQWFSLRQIPVVIPNNSTLVSDQLSRCLTKPHFEAQNAVRKIQKLKQHKLIVIYQGGINKARQLHILAKTLNKLSDKFVFVLMGAHSEYLSELKVLCPQLIHIDYIPAPFHLQITQLANIGYVSYDYNRLNHIFCAPNKIYEYSKFGIPMLFNNLSGLNNTIGVANAGICVDVCCEESISSGLHKIVNEYEYYKNNSYNFYSSINMNSIHSDLCQLF